MAGFASRFGPRFFASTPSHFSISTPVGDELATLPTFGRLRLGLQEAKIQAAHFFSWALIMAALIRGIVHGSVRSDLALASTSQASPSR